MTNTTEDLLLYKVCKILNCSDYSEPSNWCTTFEQCCGYSAKQVFKMLEKQGYTLVKNEEHYGCFFDIIDEPDDECVLDKEGYCTHAKKENITDKKNCKYWQKYFLTINP